MIKSALDFLKKEFLAGSDVKVVHGCSYAPVSLLPVKAPTANPLIVHTLQGLADYVKGNRDDVNLEKCLVHITGPCAVTLSSALIAPTRQREDLVQVDLIQAVFPFGRYITQEEFIVGVQSQFVETAERAALLKVAGSITNEAIATSEDDGVTQRATARVGIARQANIDLPNPVKLRPYRTFPEIDQPESLFVFRMRAGGGLALFEADGGAWRNKAIADIAFWLVGALKDTGVNIIA